MRFPDEPIPDCVPEFYREQQEERDRRYDLAMRRRARYQANRKKLDAAAEAGLPVLSFSGYDACRECPRADGDTQTDDEDDFCRVICHDPSCPEHMKNRTKEESR